MGIIDGLFKRFGYVAKSAPAGLFGFMLGREAPGIKDYEYKRAYMSWVYACTSVIAEQVANVDIRLMHKAKDGTVTEVENHPAIDLLYNVNPVMTSSDLMVNTQSHIELIGDSFWVLQYNLANSYPTEIYPMDPSRITVVKDPTIMVSGYVYTDPAGKQIPLDLKHVIHFKRFNPNNPYRGMGTVQAAADAIDINEFAAKWSKNVFYNSAMPSAALEVPGTLTQEQYNRIKTNWESRYQGIDNAGKLAILEGGSKFNKISLTPQELDYLETRRFTRDEILAMFRVPKSVLGIVEDVNRANAEATEVIFARWVIKPRIQFIVDRLNEFYLKLFKLSWPEYYFDYDDPVPENRELELKEYQTALGGAAYQKINEIREQEGLEPIDGGDVLYLPLNLMPVGSATGADNQAGGGQNGSGDGTEAGKGNKIGKDKKPAKDNTEGQVIPDNADSKAKAIKTLEALKAIGAEVNKDKRRSAFIDRRIRFVRSEIDRVKPLYMEKLLSQKSEVMRRLIGRKKAVVKNDSKDILDVVFDGYDAEWEGEYKALTTEVLTNSLVHSGKSVLERLGVNVNFDLKNPRVVDWLSKNALAHAKSIADTNKQAVRDLIVSGVDSGQTTGQIAESIRSFFDTQSEYRAERMARTEVIAGYSEGTLSGMRQSGLVKMKRWVTAGDDRVEEECLTNAADGPIGLDANFSSGAGAPPQHPNCRCDLYEVLAD